MNRYVCVIVLSAVLMTACSPDIRTMKNASAPVPRPPEIAPAYSGIVLPPNIAPLNFVVREEGNRYAVEISSTRGAPIVIAQNTPAMRIPPRQWKNLLSANHGEPLRINLYVRGKDGRWRGFETIDDTVAAQPIDHYCTYRILTPQYNYSTDIRIFQRNLESFETRQLISTTNFSWGCANCHTPCANDPSRFIVHLRTQHFGNATLLSGTDGLTKINSRLGYAAWHPGGNFIVFTVYQVEQKFHASAARDLVEQFDRSSDLVVYDIGGRKIVSVEKLSKKESLETWPAWSPDGRVLYFCSAPEPWSAFDESAPASFRNIRYSLMRAVYNPDSGTWGTVDTILSAAALGKSITQPRVSPDGRFLVFCMHDYSVYAHTQRSSDLYMMECATGKYGRLDISDSSASDSWHGWSENGRWLLFSSKRNSGIFTHLYFSYVDSAGIAHKPFVLPQEDPAFYESFAKCFNVPEFAIGPVTFTEREILAKIKGPADLSAPAPAQAAPPGTPAWMPTPDR